VSEHRSPEVEYVTLHDGLTLPRPMVESIVACAQTLKEQGKTPIWHMNACGCCASVHADDNGHEGFLIGSDGGFDWLSHVHE
jgi:hypothetical protein